MSDSDPKDLERIDREIRINELRHRAEEAAGGPGHVYESEDCPPEILEQFWKHVVDYEEAPVSCHFLELQKAGVELRPPDELSDEALKPELSEVIDALAKRRVFLVNTDHLDDRALYAHLWEESLREPTPMLPLDENSAYHIDLVSSGSEDDIRLWLRYYADEDTRQRWGEDFPDYDVPPHETPPHDRDRHMPRARW